MMQMSDVIADFDAIAAALETTPERDVLSPAERALLRHVPRQARRALDVGCGAGAVTRAVARRGIDVVGIDASPRMVALARARSGDDPRVSFRVGDIMKEPIPERGFDVVLAIAMVHHLPLDSVVARLAAAVTPGGVLLIQDVMTRPGLRDLPVNAVAWGWRQLRQLVTGSAIDREVAGLYDRHGRNEEYLPTSAVAAIYHELLPGAAVHRHLEWRYTVVWRRPNPSSA